MLLFWMPAGLDEAEVPLTASNAQAGFASHAMASATFNPLAGIHMKDTNPCNTCRGEDPPPGIRPYSSRALAAGGALPKLKAGPAGRQDKSVA